MRLKIYSIIRETIVSHNRNTIIKNSCYIMCYLMQPSLQTLRAHTQTLSSLWRLRCRTDSGAVQPCKFQSTRETCSCAQENRHSQSYTNAAVAADAEQCSKIGVDVLRGGGNAVDAAIAAMLGVGVINLHSTGIGGGGFMVVYCSKSKTSYAIDFRDKAPLNASTFMFERLPDLECRYGGLAIAVPGMLHGLHSLWLRFGRLPWKDLFQPAIDLAREGFEVTKDIVRAINMRRELILSGNYPGLQELLAPNGSFLKEGDTLYQPQLATTLEAIAEQGIEYFYNSSFTHELVTELQQVYPGSILTTEDFRRYTAIERHVVSAKFKDYIMLGMPPPACGVVLGLLLNILNDFDFNEDDIGIDHFHRIIEAFKFTYGQKFYLEDPDFSESVQDFTEHLLNPNTAKTMLSQIDDKATYEPKYYTDPLVIPERVAFDYGTTHLSVLDEDGNAVSATTTLNLFFGSLVRSRVSGIIFNNEMDNFGIPGKPRFEVEPKANFIAPQKRPLSTSAPTIMLNKDGSIKMVIGASGGIMIPSALAQVITGVLGFKWPLSKAVSRPRLHHQLYPNTVVLDMDVEFPLEYQRGLLEKGHDLTTTIHRAVVQGIDVDSDGIHATSDFRKGGIPCGY